MPSARIRQARPRTATAGSALLLGLGELRRALGDQRVLLPDEHGALLADVDDDLAALAERVGHRALVAHGHRAGPVPVAHPEQQCRALAVNGAVRDLPG